MSKRKSPGGVLIVVELGAEWPSLPEVRQQAAGRRVLAQAEGERPGDFGARLAEQLDGLFARGVPLTTAVLACNERLDDAAQRGRAELARAALGAMAKQRAGALVISTSARGGERMSQPLSALASELEKEWQRADVRVAVRSGEVAELAAGTSASADASGRKVA